MNRSQRVLSLAPNVSMILFALGADDVVVGRTQHCLSSIRNYVKVWSVPEAEAAPRLLHWEGLPEVGAWPQSDCERAMALLPDVVLASGTGALDVHDAEAFGLGPDSFVNFDTRTLADLDRQIAAMGKLVSRVEAARDIVARLASKRDAVLSRQARPARCPTVLFEYCMCIKYDPDPERRFANPGRFIMVGGHLAPDLIKLSGGEPLFTRPGDAVAWTDFQDIRGAQPDIVLAFDCNGCPNALKHPVDRRPGWSELAAVSHRRVYHPTKNIANPNLCYPDALAELNEMLASWDQDW